MGPPCRPHAHTEPELPMEVSDLNQHAVAQKQLLPISPAPLQSALRGLSTQEAVLQAEKSKFPCRNHSQASALALQRHVMRLRETLKQRKTRALDSICQDESTHVQSHVS